MTPVDSQLDMLNLIINTDADALLPKQWVEVSVINKMLRLIAPDEDFTAPDVVRITRTDMPLTLSAEKLTGLFVREAAALYKSARLLVRPGANDPETRR